MFALTNKSWSPYAVGVALGVLCGFAFASADRGLGITTSFEYGAALLERAVLSASATTSYYSDHSPKIDWEWMVVVGVFLGSFISSKLSNDRQSAAVPPLWRARFGSSVPMRMTVAFVSGALMMIGARLARGCTSGHGITGALQLAISSWIFIALAFVVAIASAFLMFGRTRPLGGE